MKRQQKRSFNREHQDEIQAVNELMEKIKPQLDEMKDQYPNVGIMVQFGIMDSEHHWVNRYCKMKTELVIQLCTGIIHELIEGSRRD